MTNFNSIKLNRTSNFNSIKLNRTSNFQSNQVTLSLCFCQVVIPTEIKYMYVQLTVEIAKTIALYVKPQNIFWIKNKIGAIQ